MATCASCGKDIRDNDWTCGNCGAPVTRSGGGDPSAYGYAPGFGPPPAAAAAGAPAATSDGGMSRATLTVLVVAVVAIIAIVAVWYLFLRSTPGGREYVGLWQATDQKTGSIIVAKESGDFKITMVSSTGAKTGPFKGSLKDDALELKFEAANGDDTNKAVAGLLKSLVESALKDPQLLLTVNKSTGHLIFTIKGKGPDGTPVSAPAAEYAQGTPLP